MFLFFLNLRKLESANFRYTSALRKQQSFIPMGMCNISVVFPERKRRFMIPSCFWLQISVVVCFRHVSVDVFIFYYIQKQHRSFVLHHFRNKMLRKAKPLFHDLK